MKKADDREHVVWRTITLSGFHIKGRDREALKIYTKKYTWHIPKHLRESNTPPGDIVAVGKPMSPVLVVEVFL